MQTLSTGSLASQTQTQHTNTDIDNPNIIHTLAQADMQMLQRVFLQSVQLVKVLATGSRTRSPYLLQRARLWAKQRIEEPNTLVIVGDAWGIDECIIYEFNRAQCERIWVFGWGGQVRHRTTHGTNFVLPCEPRTRNTFMLEATLPQSTTAFWDGYSHGTKDTIDKSRALRLPTKIIQAIATGGNEDAE